MTYETHAPRLKEDNAYALERQPKMQRREVLTRIKLVSKVGSLVSFRPNDRVGYNPVMSDGYSEAIRTLTEDGIKSYLPHVLG